MTPIIIGLTGSARSGKTSIAEHLRDKHDFIILSFADPLKDMVKKLDPIIGVDEDSQYAHYADPVAYPVVLSDFLDEDGEFFPEPGEDWVKAQYPEYRRILQVFGTELMRNYDKNFWRDQLVERLDTLLFHGRSAHSGVRVVIPDVRFPNEAEVVRDYVHAKGGLANVYRPGHQGNSHTSETHAGLLGEPICFVNDGTLDELLSAVDGYVEELTN